MDARFSPLIFDSGLNTREPEDRSATLMNWPASTGLLLTVSEPFSGRVEMNTPNRLSPSMLSENPKSSGSSDKLPFSVSVSVLSAPDGR